MTTTTTPKEIAGRAAELTARSESLQQKLAALNTQRPTAEYALGHVLRICEVSPARLSELRAKIWPILAPTRLPDKLGRVYGQVHKKVRESVLEVFRLAPDTLGRVLLVGDREDLSERFQHFGIGAGELIALVAADVLQGEGPLADLVVGLAQVGSVGDWRGHLREIGQLEAARDATRAELEVVRDTLQRQLKDIRAAIAAAGVE